MVAPRRSPDDHCRLDRARAMLSREVEHAQREARALRSNTTRFVPFAEGVGYRRDPAARRLMSATELSWNDGHAIGEPPPASDFHIDVEPERDAVRVCPAGDVDLATVQLVRTQV